MTTVQLQHPKRTVFGPGCLSGLVEDRLLAASVRPLFLVASPLMSTMVPVLTTLESSGKTVLCLEFSFPGEPTFAWMEQLLGQSADFRPDVVVGVGGGSVLDCAKLLAALTGHDQALRDVPGINILRGRKIGLVCLPTTSGTGSEMSPNAILLDETTQEKKGIISPDLVPDAVYVDPELTLSLPSRLTAETGFDALSHCIEAYTNRFAHPAVDLYALEGIRLIASNLQAACLDGSDLQARTALSRGSMYGGLCLGPVNTAAVHALSYGLGGKHHVPHGLANAMLLPDVLLFNLPACVARTADVARALGVSDGLDDEQTALAGIDRLRQLASQCGIPTRLRDIGLLEEDLPGLAEIALGVKRLLNNNPRELTYDDAVRLFRQLY